MSKSKLTNKLETGIYKHTCCGNNFSVYGCFEVTIGWSGRERVDFLTYDNKSIFRCYEIKSSIADFRSKAKKSFIGHYNYYVLPYGLYQKIESEIPEWVGVYVSDGCRTECIKKAKRQKDVNDKLLADSMIRSQNRDIKKHRDSENIEYLTKLRKELQKEKKESKSLYSNSRHYQWLFSRLKRASIIDWIDIIEEEFPELKKD